MVSGDERIREPFGSVARDAAMPGDMGGPENLGPGLRSTRGTARRCRDCIFVCQIGVDCRRTVAELDRGDAAGGASADDSY